VFFIVIISSIVPGAVVKPAARWLGINVETATTPAAPLLNPTASNLVSIGT
jgi:hypothetical protein